MNFYWSAVVNISCSVFELFDIDLEICHLVIQNGTIRKLGCGFLFALHSNYGSTLHQFRDKARYLSKIVIYSYGPCIRRPG